MRGTGFQCDQCGVREVLDADPYGGPRYFSLPTGWVGLSMDSGPPAEFCSFVCVEDYARDRHREAAEA